ARQRGSVSRGRCLDAEPHVEPHKNRSGLLVLGTSSVSGVDRPHTSPDPYAAHLPLTSPTHSSLDDPPASGPAARKARLLRACPASTSSSLRAEAHQCPPST